MARGYSPEERRQIAAGTFFTDDELRRNPRLGQAVIDAEWRRSTRARRDPNDAPVSQEARDMLAQMEDLPPLDIEAGLTETNPETRTGPGTSDMRSLAEWLTATGFKFEGNRGWGGDSNPWYRKDMIGVVIEDEGYITVHVFDARYPRCDIVAWNTAFTNAPLSIITATIRSAMGTD